MNVIFIQKHYEKAYKNTRNIHAVNKENVKWFANFATNFLSYILLSLKFGKQASHIICFLNLFFLFLMLIHTLSQPTRGLQKMGSQISSYLNEGSGTWPFFSLFPPLPLFLHLLLLSIYTSVETSSQLLMTVMGCKECGLPWRRSVCEWVSMVSFNNQLTL